MEGIEMSDRLTEEQIYELAKTRVEARRSFTIHLIVYLGVNAMLFCLWFFVVGRGFPWFVFPLGGWGIGLICHYFVAYGPGRGPDNRAAIGREVEKIRREQS